MSSASEPEAMDQASETVPQVPSQLPQAMASTCVPADTVNPETSRLHAFERQQSKLLRRIREGIAHASECSDQSAHASAQSLCNERTIQREASVEWRTA